MFCDFVFTENLLFVNNIFSHWKMKICCFMEWLWLLLSPSLVPFCGGQYHSFTRKNQWLNKKVYFGIWFFFEKDDKHESKANNLWYVLCRECFSLYVRNNCIFEQTLTSCTSAISKIPRFKLTFRYITLWFFVCI